MNKERNRHVNEYLKFYVIHEIECLHDCVVNSFLFQSKLELLIVEGEFSMVNCSRVSIADSSMMMKFAFVDASTVTSQNNSNCIFERNGDPVVFSGFLLTFSFTQYKEPVVLSGLILTFIGLVLGLIIIFIKNLHTKSTMNTIVIVITVS
ncbi:uncharacterized protein DC041_0007629 [Schistosoma bovis]|uniref:Uncharacterized protein n=1 Tax=Schistosoma bovis TaxID=6184 RepID=A0A430Q4Y1_SCHBO|nr:uncharacterized protein DC041_0007629 [Schistosoma bovis]